MLSSDSSSVSSNYHLGLFPYHRFSLQVLILLIVLCRVLSILPGILAVSHSEA
ncbi:unnamed protein product [Nyctereutes procyonoides]|uniref:(raccoon dog) hypothetical protein n=1 Tax=Nyctereutes procyonoides TaxID=34880 RepID=A0A811ZY46_NYCPR|nr:unnamed protein product [Nyctereutes procyonoides]